MRLLEGKAVAFWMDRTYGIVPEHGQVSPTYSLARQSASDRRRIAAFSLRSFGEGGLAKAGNAKLKSSRMVQRLLSTLTQGNYGLEETGGRAPK